MFLSSFDVIQHFYGVDLSQGMEEERLAWSFSRRASVPQRGKTSLLYTICTYLPRMPCHQHMILHISLSSCKALLCLVHVPT